MVQRKRDEEKKKKITLTIDREVHNRFTNYCRERGMKVSSKVELMIKDLLMEDLR